MAPPGPGASAPPSSHAGIGLRAPHYRDILEGKPRLAFLEVHSENFFGGGIPSAWLDRLRAEYPVSLHGVGLSLGSSDPLDERHLDQLEALARRVEPALVSEHLCWSSAGGRHANDLLPLPYTEEALAHVVRRVDAVQERLGRRILVENVSTYLEFTESTLDEAAFVAEVVRRSGCGLLLDVNNIWVNAVNHGLDARAWLEAVPAEAVEEIHLAGFERSEGVLIDTHGSPVAPEVWDLYAEAIARLGPRPTLIEWDTDIPELAVLLDEAGQATRILEAAA